MRAFLGFCLVTQMVMALPAAGTAKDDEGVAPPQLADALVPIVRIPAEFPPEAPEMLTEGWVVVEFTLTARGGVEAPRAVQSSHQSFETEALRSVCRWIPPTDS